MHALPGGLRKGGEADAGRQVGSPIYLEDLCQVMGDASICGLGQAAPNPIRLVMKHFADEI